MKNFTNYIIIFDKLLSLWRKHKSQIKGWFKKTKKEDSPSQPVEVTTSSAETTTLNAIVDADNNQEKTDISCGLFQQGEMHIICAPTGGGKSIMSVEMGLAIAGGKGSKYHAMVKNILGDDWNFSTQRVDYIDGENGKDVLRQRYRKQGMRYPDLFNITPAGKIYTIDKLEESIRYRAKEMQSKGNLTIIIDHPGCYEGSENCRRMEKFYKALKNITTSYREGGYYLTIFICAFVNTDKPWKPVYSTNITGTKDLRNSAHTIVALCPCSMGEEYKFLKVIKARGKARNKEVTVLKINEEEGLFFHLACKMDEQNALPSPVKKQKTTEKSVTHPTMSPFFPPIPVTGSEKKNSTESVAHSVWKTDARRKVTPEILVQIKQMFTNGMTQNKIASTLGLCRKTIIKYLQQPEHKEVIDEAIHLRTT